MSYGSSSYLNSRFGTTYGNTYRRSGFGRSYGVGATNILADFSPAKLFDTSIVTPAERVGQLATLGAIGGLAASAILLLASNTVPKKKRWPVLGLAALPAAAAVGGVMLAGSEYRA